MAGAGCLGNAGLISVTAIAAVSSGAKPRGLTTKIRMPRHWSNDADENRPASRPESVTGPVGLWDAASPEIVTVSPEMSLELGVRLMLIMFGAL
eukprot:3568617-Rhodomonas_salina.8